MREQLLAALMVGAITFSGSIEVGRQRARLATDHSHRCVPRTSGSSLKYRLR